ncbi:MAG: FapA family protein [Pseudothermotoga sp.]
MKAQVKVSSNGLEAYIIVQADENEEITRDMIISQLQGNGVVYGILEENIDDLIKKKTFGIPVLVALGKEPVNGEDGQVIVIQPEKQESTEQEKSRIDLRELPSRARQIVKAGQEIAEIIPPTPGVEGRNVFGRSLNPKPGKPPQLKLGKNVKLSEDGKKIIASVDGMLVAKADGSVDVNEMLVIKGDVDYATGNIDFPGEVQISGDVRPGFSVKAKGNVTVSGVIEAATVISYEGSVNTLGVKGREKGIVKAKEDIIAKFLENAIMEAGQNVIVNGPITNSQIKAGVEVRATGNKGIIAGGMIVAGFAVEAEEIGSPLGIKTTIEIGFDPQTREEIKVIRAKLELDKENLTKLVNIYRTLKALMEKNQGQLPPDKMEIYRKVGQSMINLRNTIEMNEKQLQELEAQIKEKLTRAKVIARKILHPGVEVTIFEKRFYADRALEKAVVLVENQEIRLGGYSGDTQINT